MITFYELCDSDGRASLFFASFDAAKDALGRGRPMAKHISFEDDTHTYVEGEIFWEIRIYRVENATDLCFQLNLREANKGNDERP